MARPPQGAQVLLIVIVAWLVLDGARLLQQHQASVAGLFTIELERLQAIVVGSAALLEPGGDPDTQRRVLAHGWWAQEPLALLRLRPDALGAVTAEPDRIHPDALEVIATSGGASLGAYVAYHPIMAPALLEGRASRGWLAGPGGPMGSAYGPLEAGDGAVLGVVAAQRSLQPLQDQVWAQDLRSILLSWTLLIVVCLVVGWSRGHLRRAVQGVEASATRLGLGDYTTPVDPPLARDTAPLIDALEHSRRRIRRHVRGLVRDKEILSDELALARERLSDPVVDRRRAALQPLALEGRIILGRVSAPIRVRDLWLDHVVVAMEAALLGQLVPGMLVQLELIGPEGALPGRGAIAQAPDGDRVEGHQTFRFSWSTPWAPLELGPVLWDTINPRRALRISPPDHPPVRAVLEVGPRCLSARVLDLSTEGVGVLLSVGLSELGELSELGPDTPIHLILELDSPRRLRAQVWVRSMDQRATGTRLGLAFGALAPGQLAPLRAYLVEAQRDQAGDDRGTSSGDELTTTPPPRSPRGAPAPPRSPPPA